MATDDGTNNNNNNNDEPQVVVSADYALGQLARALTSARTHRESDDEHHTRVKGKVDKWERVLQGMLSGSTTVGSRAPIRDVPTWATLEVVHGGFATGGLLAGGELRPHEIALCDRLHLPRERTALNIHYLSDDGRRELTALLETRCYRIEVPEEGALLTVAWLLTRGEQVQAERAEAIIDAIAPFFDRLRFYPVPAASPFREDGSIVKVETTAETAKRLAKIETPRAIEAMHESIRVWTPLLDRAVSLFLETVEGDVLPSLRTSAQGDLVRREGDGGHPFVDGGWPCRHFPDGWSTRARALLRDYADAGKKLKKTKRLSSKAERPKENIALLRRYLEICVQDTRKLTGRDVGMIRKVLASFITAHGAPGSERHTRTREQQARMASAPTHASIARELSKRLRTHPAESGLGALEEVIGAPLESGLSGAQIPAHLLERIERCLEASADELVERGVISSGEVLARVLPQITAQLRAAGIVDSELRALYAAIYTAFRRRRSLLLVNLESQVRIHELPWVAAIEERRGEKMDARAATRLALEQIVALYLRGFPQTLIPNKLLQELRALLESAKETIPLLDELAADIFMGKFSAKFLEAAQITARMVHGTLYERYYDIPCDRVLAINDVDSRQKPPISAAFGALCMARAAAHAKTGYGVARNGTIIEQQQILTTQNLAALVHGLALEPTLRPDVVNLAKRAFTWIVRRQMMKMPRRAPLTITNNTTGTTATISSSGVDFRARMDRIAVLRMLKNTAYAWRQMIFYLSLASNEDVASFLSWADEHLAKRAHEEFRARFAPAMSGLKHVALGGVFDQEGHAPNARRFLGWTTGPHWLAS